MFIGLEDKLEPVVKSFVSYVYRTMTEANFHDKIPPELLERFVHVALRVKDATRTNIEDALKHHRTRFLEFCKRVRPYLAAGIVMCTGRSERELRIQGLNDGADAYLVKPVDPDEIQATIASVLRRVSTPLASPMVSSSLMLVWTLDPVRQVLSVSGQSELHISRREALLLSELFRSPQQVATRDSIFKMFELAGSPMTGPSLEVMVSRLRKKVLDRTGQQFPLQSNYGEGYVFGGHSRLR